MKCNFWSYAQAWSFSFHDLLVLSFELPCSGSQDVDDGEQPNIVMMVMGTSLEFQHSALAEFVQDLLEQAYLGTVHILGGEF